MTWNFENNVVDADDDECVFIKQHEPVAVVSRKAETQIRTLLEKYKDKDLEWMAGLIGSKVNENQYYIKEIKLFEQTVSSAFVELTPKGNKDAALEKELLGMVHSHNKMGTYHSSTDIEHDKMYELNAVVNNDMDFEGKSRFTLPCSKKVIVDCEFELESALFEADGEIANLANKLITERKEDIVVVKGESKANESEYDIDICHVCQNMIGRKSVECNICHQRVHTKCAFKGVCDNCFEYAYEGKSYEGKYYG